jgi:predicted transcriptional regulator
VIPALSTALTDERVSPRDFQVLFLLVTIELEPVNYREVKLAVIAKQLEQDESTISRSLTRLVEAGYLERLPSTRPAQYRFKYQVANLQADQAS